MFVVMIYIKTTEKPQTPNNHATKPATAKKAEEPSVKPVVETASPTQEAVKPVQDEREQTYLFALQMINARSYDIAEKALVKIKGYKNVDELLKQIENKI